MPKQAKGLRGRKNPQFTEAINEAFRAKGLRQRELGRIVGVSAMSISRYLAGGIPENNNLVVSLAKALDLDGIQLVRMAYNYPVREDVSQNPRMNLAKAIDSKGLNPQIVAYATGITTRRITKILTGAVDPLPRERALISSVLETTETSLFDKQNKSAGQPKNK